MQTSNRTRILFLIFVVLGVYYPVIFAGVNSVDDYKMISQLEDISRIDWRGLFMPGGGYYYRPLLMLTYFADKFLWGLNESFMHLENIIIHAANAVLLFFVALKVFSRPDMLKVELPLLSALVFALHPINTEAVAWISGRTDPLATLFVLISLLMLIKGLETGRSAILLCSTFVLLLGAMCKEVAAFFFPVSCLIAYRWPGEAANPGVDRRLTREKIVKVVTVALPFLAGGTGYLLVRLIAYGSRDKGIIQIVKGFHYDLFNGVRVIFKVFGFYVKKLFQPLPLNFAIARFDDNYVWLGVAMFLLLLLLLRRRQMAAVFFVAAFYLISPAILVAVSRIAWTPVAERYLYLPSALFSLGLVGGLYLLLERKEKTCLLVPGIVLLLFPAAWATSQRNIVWQDNLTLYQDTMAQSPELSFIRGELAIALMAKGKYDEANRQLEEGKSLDQKQQNVLLYLNQAILRFREGKVVDARKILTRTFTSKDKTNQEVLKMLAKIDEQRLFQAKSAQEQRAIQRELMDTYDHLFLKTGDPGSLYRGGQMAMFLGENWKAAELFRKAYQLAPADAHYKQAALKLSEKLAK
jgi:tetratricopeptide (TPR) repeat protein